MKPIDSLRNSAVIYSLKKTTIFSDLADEVLARIASYASIIPLHKNDYVFREGEEAKGFYIVRQGIINIHHVTAGGREQVIHIFRTGETFAEAALVNPTGYPANARAEVDSEVILIPSREFLQQQRDNPELSARMLASMSMHLHMLVSLVGSIKLKNTETRFLHWLLSRCPKPLPNKPTVIELGMSKAVLAAELSTRQETLSRIFAKLREAELIDIKRNVISINSPQNLQQIFEQQLMSAN